MERLNDDTIDEIMSLDINDLNNAVLGRVKGQDEAVKHITANIYVFLQSWALGKPEYNFTTLIAGPSGVGKTETYEAINEYFKTNLPSIIISRKNATNLSEAGFVGEDSYGVLLSNAGDIIRHNTLEICFFDEFDKIAQNKHNERLQGQILQIIEGNEIYYKKIKCSKKTIDTKRILFICSGAFANIEEVQKKRKYKIQTQEFGFSKKISKVDITHEDLVNYGLLAELAGRICTICNYHELDKDTITQIFNMKLKKYENIFDCRISASPDFCQYCLEDTIKMYGAREIDSMINRVVCENCIHFIDSELNEMFLDYQEVDGVVVKYR